MAWNWLDRIIENKKNKELREEKENKQQLQELAKGDEFKQMVKDAAKVIIHENMEAAKLAKLENARAHEVSVTKAKEDINLVSDSMQDSTEPFVAVLGMGFDKHQGLKITLDWNDAFIRYLTAAGIKGNNDEETIRIWLANLNYDISQEVIASDYILNGVDDTEMPSMNYDKMFGLDENGEPIDNDDGDMGGQPEEDRSSE
jgi:hypothetical protein